MLKSLSQAWAQDPVSVQGRPFLLILVHISTSWWDPHQLQTSNEHNNQEMLPTYMYLPTYLLYIFIHRHKYIHTYIHTYIPTYLLVPTYLPTYIHTYIHTCTFIYRTYIHVQTFIDTYKGIVQLLHMYIHAYFEYHTYW